MDDFTRLVRYQPLDSVNLVFYGATIDEIVLALGQAGWSTNTIQDDQQLSDDSITLKNQDQYLIKGTAGISRVSKHLQRFHVRLWSFSDFTDAGGKAPRVVGAAHHEKGLSKRPPFIGHRVDSFDAGKIAVTDDLRGLQGWSVFENGVYVGNKISKPANDGWATFIAKK